MTGTRSLVADIGATNARFGLLDASGRLLHTQTLPCIGHATLEEAARAYLDAAQPGRASGRRRHRHRRAGHRRSADDDQPSLDLLGQGDARRAGTGPAGGGQRLHRRRHGDPAADRGRPAPGRRRRSGRGRGDRRDRPRYRAWRLGPCPGRHRLDRACRRRRPRHHGGGGRPRERRPQPSSASGSATSPPNA